MDAIVSGSFGKPSARPHRYGLHLREGPPGGLVWRFRDEGVVLTPLGIEWTAGGTKRSMTYGDILGIRLQTGHIPKSGYFGTCMVTFRSGLVLTVNSMSERGYADDDRLDDYAEFLQDLHARLGDEDRRRIHFIAGNSAGRQTMLKAAVVLGGAFFVVLPLVLALVTGEFKALLLLLAGAGFMIPAFRTMRKNEPRNYDPGRLDEDLFPHT